ncbi:MAG: peptidylprolyl isomerase [Flavobacteriaceae bacterium]|nr:peptidylprolyl isomerase [Flavobacteriaceae bacterium]MDH3795941.1 peptidylprolyl isomerase [Flavobacteriaceae bacterium]
MAILENIRKRTTILILIIGMALFAFVISGIFTGNDMGGVKTGSTIAEINGEEIPIDEFRKRIERASRLSRGSSSMQLVNSIWTQMERNTILGQQINNLGISIEENQIIDVIKNSPGLSQNPQFQDENGLFDENRFRDFIAELRANAPTQYDDWLQDEASIVQNAKEQTYLNYIKAGLGATLKEGEWDYKLANDKVDIRYVRVPYNSIADSTIVVTKKEIADYINDRKEEYKQEEARDIQFVYFEEKPSVEDEAAIQESIRNLLKDRVEYFEERDTTDTIPGFRNTTDNEAFLTRNSDTKFDTIYKAKSELPAQFADSLMALNIGDLYGPYKDGNAFKVTKMVAKKPNGSVKASHILLAYAGAERVDPSITRTKEEAEAKANEVLAEALKSDTDFATLARNNSDGPSAPQGGDLGFFQEGIMTPKFNDFAFGNSIGHVGLVETEFGYHIVKVMEKQDLVQVATLSREIEPSEATINSLFTDATKFEMATTSGDAAFTDVARDSEYIIRPVNQIKAMDENLPGLSTQRNIVQWAFNADTEVGDIKRFNINNGYAVVQLTAKYREGVMAVEDASATVLPQIRKDKKAEQIMIGNAGKSLEDLASSNNTIISTASALTVKAPTIAGAGREPLVVGSAFALDQGGTSGLIKGETGIFIIEVTRKEVAPELENYSTYANTLGTGNATRANSAVYLALKEKAEIEDNRPVFY